MNEWLAHFNKEEEGESLLFSKLGEVEGECRHGKMKSGMLEKSSMNIRQKQTWPQKNLGEDWAEEELDFKQLRFEHLVAGETRTIETCTEPAQILGHLKLLSRIAYLKLRGYEWPILRRMYAAIVTSIKTGEYSWESNFDRFKTILYSKTHTENRYRNDKDRPTDKKQWFCRDYNKPEGCPRNSPHPAWVGSGPAAVKRTVVHGCATCLIRDRAVKPHPEGHPSCPHRDWLQATPTATVTNKQIKQNTVENSK